MAASSGTVSSSYLPKSVHACSEDLKMINLVSQSTTEHNFQPRLFRLISFDILFVLQIFGNLYALLALNNTVLQDLRVDGKYRLQRRIGSGGFGAVYIGTSNTG